MSPTTPANRLRRIAQLPTWARLKRKRHPRPRTQPQRTLRPKSRRTRRRQRRSSSSAVVPLELERLQVTAKRFTKFLVLQRKLDGCLQKAKFFASVVRNALVDVRP